jgi:[acyl-carrier-protein] S-malonyltransferase
VGLGILCPGQGAQHPGMLDPLRGEPEAERVLALASTLLEPPVADILSRDDNALFSNVIAQPLICIVELATWAALSSRLPSPRVFAGYSVGELAAYGCAGALDAQSLVALAHERATAMDTACRQPCRMSAVRDLARGSIEDLTRIHGVEIAIINAEDRMVVGGLASAMASFETAAQDLGASVTPLAVNVASHTSLMEPAAKTMRRLLQESSLVAPRTPVLAGIDGTPVLSRTRAVETLAKQTAQTILWHACLEGLREAGCTVLLELGPGADLARMARERLPGIEARSVTEFRSLLGSVAWVTRHLCAS